MPDNLNLSKPTRVWAIYVQETKNSIEFNFEAIEVKMDFAGEQRQKPTDLFSHFFK